MILKAQLGLLVCGLVGSAAISLLPPDEGSVDAASPTGAVRMSSDPSSDSFESGMAEAHAAAKHPFASFAPRAR